MDSVLKLVKLFVERKYLGIRIVELSGSDHLASSTAIDGKDCVIPKMISTNWDRVNE